MLIRSLVAAALGLLLLAFLLAYLPPQEITAPHDLAMLLINQKVTASGIVQSERIIRDETRLMLANGIEVRCSCQTHAPLKNKQVAVTGTLQRYRNATWIEAFTIVMDDDN